MGKQFISITAIILFRGIYSMEKNHNNGIENHNATICKNSSEKNDQSLNIENNFFKRIEQDSCYQEFIKKLTESKTELQYSEIYFDENDINQLNIFQLIEKEMGKK